jgi:hypothetical protein
VEVVRSQVKRRQRKMGLKIVDLMLSWKEIILKRSPSLILQILHYGRKSISLTKRRKFLFALEGTPILKKLLKREGGSKIKITLPHVLTLNGF